RRVTLRAASVAPFREGCGRALRGEAPGEIHRGSAAAFGRTAGGGSSLGGLWLLGREPGGASTGEAGGGEGGGGEAPSPGDQIFRDVVEAGGHVGPGPIAELVSEPLLHSVQGVVGVCVSHAPSVAAARTAAPGGHYEVGSTGARTACSLRCP